MTTRKDESETDSGTSPRKEKSPLRIQTLEGEMEGESLLGVLAYAKNLHMRAHPYNEVKLRERIDVNAGCQRETRT